MQARDSESKQQLRRATIQNARTLRWGPSAREKIENLGMARSRPQNVFDPILLMALCVPSEASAATAKYHVPVVRPVSV
jgi:hypothetical protein